MKKIVMMVAATVAAWCSWGAASISINEVSNHYPWDGKVECVFTFSGAETDYTYKGAFTLSVEKDGVTVRRVVTNDIGRADGTYKNTFDCMELFGAGCYPNGGITVKLIKRIYGVQLWAGGPYIAECNVGANKPEEYGYYFWWGDTVGYRRGGSGWSAVDGSASGFKFNSSNSKIVTNNKSVGQLLSDGYIDSKGNLVAKYDGAAAHLGGSWRIMTSAEVSKLSDTSYCTRTWTSNWNDTGISGYVVTGAQEGYTDKSIFLPAAGYGYDAYLTSTGTGFYWSSTPFPDNPEYTWYHSFNSGSFGLSCYGFRSGGQPIRPVRPAAE